MYSLGLHSSKCKLKYYFSDMKISNINLILLIFPGMVLFSFLSALSLSTTGSASNALNSPGPLLVLNPEMDLPEGYQRTGYLLIPEQSVV